jgi:hypothetical protein
VEAEPVIVSTGKDVPFEFRVVRERDGRVTSMRCTNEGCT